MLHSRTLLFIYSVYKSVHLLTPIAYSIPPSIHHTTVLHPFIHPSIPHIYPFISPVYQSAIHSSFTYLPIISILICLFIYSSTHSSIPLIYPSRYPIYLINDLLPDTITLKLRLCGCEFAGERWEVR